VEGIGIKVFGKDAAKKDEIANRAVFLCSRMYILPCKDDSNPGEKNGLSHYEFPVPAQRSPYRIEGLWQSWSPSGPMLSLCSKGNLGYI
jgi:hypothetical protein